VAGAAASVADGFEAATRSIDSGAAAATLDRWIATSNRGAEGG
jgi:anthranilate phosphoribosyltransferase